MTIFALVKSCTNTRKTPCEELSVGLQSLSVLSAIAMAVSVSAQTENYVPKHEFSISGFGGLSTLNYKVNIPQNPFIDGVDRKMGLGGGVGLDWTYHFSKHWGLRLGVQAALYNAKAKKDFTLNGIYMRDQALIDIDGKLQEKQRAVYAQVPLMVQWMTPAGKNHFYVALGGKLGMRLWDNYKQIADAKATYHPVYNAPTRAAYDPEREIHESYRGTIGLKRFDVMGSAEVGMRWTLGNGTGLYTGLYFDYGFLNTAPKAKGVSATMGEFDVEDVRDMSILSAELRGIPQSQDRTVAPTTTNFRLVDKVHKMAGGLVLRLSFGKGKAVVAPCPECPQGQDEGPLERPLRFQQVRHQPQGTDYPQRRCYLAEEEPADEVRTQRPHRRQGFGCLQPEAF